MQAHGVLDLESSANMKFFVIGQSPAKQFSQAPTIQAGVQFKSQEYGSLLSYVLLPRSSLSRSTAKFGGIARLALGSLQLGCAFECGMVCRPLMSCPMFACSLGWAPAYCHGAL